MNFELIDYSEYYFKKIANEPVPAIRGGKFVQIRNGKREYLVLSPARLSMYHANIVERFSALNDLDGHWNSGKTVYAIVDPSWTIVGGGRWAIDSGNKTLDLDSSSQAYGRFDPAGLAARILSLDAMKGYAVRIDGI